MQRVITVSLNQNPYSLEEDAHARLEQYLAESAATLASNPDRAEILADLEQAIADQCTRRLQPGRSVITLIARETVSRLVFTMMEISWCVGMCSIMIKPLGLVRAK